MFTRRDRIIFRLKYPNEEIRISFNEHLITCYTDYTIEKENFENNTYNAMMQGDFKALEATIKRLFAGISYRNFTNNDLLEFEGYYASVLYAFFYAFFSAFFSAIN